MAGAGVDPAADPIALRVQAVDIAPEVGVIPLAEADTTKLF